MKNSKEKTKQKIEEFNKKFGKRLDTLEFMYQNHGGEPWEGQTIADWLSTTLLAVRSETKEEYKGKTKRIAYQMGYKDGIAEYKSTLLEKVRKMKKENPRVVRRIHTLILADIREGFNQALDQIESIIGEK